jgi:hypothetical protein
MRLRSYGKTKDKPDYGDLSDVLSVKTKRGSF